MRILSENFLFWFSKSLDFVLIFILLYFTGGQESPLFFLLFMPALETALTKDVKKTDSIALVSLLLMVYFFFNKGFVLSYNDWLSFFLYVGALGLISYLALKLSELREEITQKEDIQRYLLSSLSAGLLFLDPNLKVLSWNPRAREILGKIARGQSLKEILGQDISTEVSRGETNLGKRILGYSIFPLRREKEILGWGFLFQDITELKKKERRLREAEKLASLGTMAAGLIHEIKNPLASISGGVQFLKENLGSSGELGQVLEVISRETERLNRLVTNFLFFARPERGEKERFNLKDLLREILDTNQPLFSQVKMKARVPSVEIEANKEQWRQILENLLINAVEASREVQRSEVEIEVELLDRDYLIKVRDYGSGIKEDIRSRIFEPFFTTKPTGTGLGLAVVYRIVENLKGEVKLFSKEGEGTLFEIKLPR
ncbi:Flagellar sensor histidine kinase FleS [Thermosulfurimonas dismutans]|uniref:histidine kinase n=1 Tax=Thermosulfurimonas dismutans TaxID=999894 RepID=A0A179D509_9BACT|nr:Flagellar sensor histidine kinase FleS [Thermosulfurimonas dismutans]